jgi:hypothetical protein
MAELLFTAIYCGYIYQWEAEIDASLFLKHKLFVEYDVLEGMYVYLYLFCYFTDFWAKNLNIQMINTALCLNR